MRVLVVGASSWDTIVHVDRLPEPVPQTIHATRSYESLGSTGAGKAMNLAQLGHEVHLHTVLGDDEPGWRAAEALRTGGVLLHLDRDPIATEQHVNVMSEDGGRLSIYRHSTTISPDADLTALLPIAAECDAVVVNITDYARQLLPHLATIGIDFWTDLHDWDGSNLYHRDFISARYIQLSADALPSPAAVCGPLAQTHDLVVCTAGSLGATAWTPSAVQHTPAWPVNRVVDTNGAGDAFTAGLLHGWYSGWPLPRTLRAAAVMGAASVASTALTGSTTADDLDVMTR